MITDHKSCRFCSLYINWTLNVKLLKIFLKLGFIESVLGFLAPTAPQFLQKVGFKILVLEEEYFFSIPSNSLR